MNPVTPPSQLTLEPGVTLETLIREYQQTLLPQPIVGLSTSYLDFNLYKSHTNKVCYNRMQNERYFIHNQGRFVQ